MRIDKTKHVRTPSPTLALGCACLIALAGIHCGRGNDRALSHRSTVTVLYPGDERVLGPNWEMPAKFLVFLTLVSYDESGQPQPRLAESWEHSPDYLDWTIHLRKDVRWHDGMAVTAHDVKFSLELLTQPDILYEDPVINSITVLNDYSFRILYTQPFKPFYAWAVIYPKHLLEDHDPKEFFKWDFWTHPVGNGPYRYVRHVPKTMIELEANPDYFRGKPKIERVILKFGETWLTELLSGNVDALTYVNQVDVLKLSGDPRFRVYHQYRQMDGLWVFAIYWNHHNPLFRDVAVRRALTLAVNRRELAQALIYPDDIPIFDVIFSSRLFRRGELPEPLPYDPERANQLLRQAGWYDVDGDGMLEKNLQPFSFTALIPAGTVMEKVAVYVQDQFSRVGIQMEVQSLDRGLVRKRLRSGEFEAALYEFWNHISGYRAFFGENSQIGYKNPKIIDFIKAHGDGTQISLDHEEEDRNYREIMPIFRDDIPITFLFPQIQSFLVHRRIQGLSTPYRADPVMNMEYLWLEEEEK